MKGLLISLLVILLFTSCNKSGTNAPVPVIASLTTIVASAITSTTAASGGNIGSDGGAGITARGVCWNTSTGPTVANIKTINGTGTGNYTSSLTGINAGTTYYIRAYATNSAGTAYGNEVVFTTLTPIPNVTICAQVWMLKNLEVSNYRNGDPIPNVTDPVQWGNLTTGAWCYFNNDPANGAIYGKLYNWYAVNDPRGLAPLGWHVPADAEWTTLETCLGGASVAGGKMKETGTTNWQNPNNAATNSSSWTGLPGGYRDASGPFVNVGYTGLWWSSTEYFPTGGWIRSLSNTNVNSFRTSTLKGIGFSVRCLKD